MTRGRQARRWTGLGAALATAPLGQVAGLRALAALGVAIEVIPPPVAWEPAATGALVVANHVSWLDDIALLTALPGVRPVAKAEIADWPVVGRAARRAGTVFLDRARLSRLPATVAEVSAALRAGRDVLVHPEGTTTCGSELGRFRTAFFQSAVDAGAPVHPVALRYRTADGSGTAVAGYLGEEPLWRSLGRVIAASGLVLELHCLPALQPGEDRRVLAALAEYAVAAVTEARAPVVAGHTRVRTREPVPSPRASIPSRTL